MAVSGDNSPKLNNGGAETQPIYQFTKWEIPAEGKLYVFDRRAQTKEFTKAQTGRMADHEEQETNENMKGRAEIEKHDGKQSNLQ